MTDNPPTAPADAPPAAAGRMPALYLGHGAPMLVDDPVWPAELRAWALSIARPSAILVVSAHWESAPVTLGATTPTELTYDFYGFPLRYYQVRYDAPPAPALAERVAKLMPAHEEVARDEKRGLDHGAYVPLLVMYPEADIPVLQMSMPDLDPQHLFRLGQALAPLRDEGVLIVGSGFMTHGLPFVHEYLSTGKPGAPAWSMEFDRWATEALERRDLDALFDFRRRAPGMPYAHPTVEHLAPLFVALGASTVPDEPPASAIDGYWYGLAKRSFQMR